jgi:hypothetical protein
LSSISLATDTPSLVTVGAPKLRLVFTADLADELVKMLIFLI